MGLKKSSRTEVDKAVREVLSREKKVRLRDLISLEIKRKEGRVKKQSQNYNQQQIQNAVKRIRDKELNHQQRNQAFEAYIFTKNKIGEL